MNTIRVINSMHLIGCDGGKSKPTKLIVSALRFIIRTLLSFYTDNHAIQSTTIIVVLVKPNQSNSRLRLRISVKALCYTGIYFCLVCVSNCH